MRKIVLLASILISLLSLNGEAIAKNLEYKGNPIVIVKSGDRVIQSKDVPAFLYENRTMVPIYLLNQLGVETTWNSQTNTVNVSLPNDPHPAKEQEAQTENKVLENSLRIIMNMNKSMLMLMEEVKNAEQDNLPNDAAQLTEEYGVIQKQYSQYFNTILKIYGSVTDERYKDLLVEQSNTVDQVSQCFSLFKTLTNNTISEQMRNGLSISIKTAIHSIALNQEHAVELMQEILLNSINKEVQPQEQTDSSKR